MYKVGVSELFFRNKRGKLVENENKFVVLYCCQMSRPCCQWWTRIVQVLVSLFSGVGVGLLLSRGEKGRRYFRNLLAATSFGVTFGILRYASYSKYFTEYGLLHVGFVLTNLTFAGSVFCGTSQTSTSLTALCLTTSNTPGKNGLHRVLPVTKSAFIEITVCLRNIREKHELKDIAVLLQFEID